MLGSQNFVKSVNFISENLDSLVRVTGYTTPPGREIPESIFKTTRGKQRHIKSGRHKSDRKNGEGIWH